MHLCTHCGQSHKAEAYVEHVKACIQEVLMTRSAAEQSARYFASIYRVSRFKRKTPDLLIRRWE